MARFAELLKEGNLEALRERVVEQLMDLEDKDRPTDSGTRFHLDYARSGRPDPDSPTFQMLYAVHAYYWHKARPVPGLPHPFTHESKAGAVASVLREITGGYLNDSQERTLATSILGTLYRAKLLQKPLGGRSKVVWLRAWDSGAIDGVVSVGNKMVDQNDWRTEKRIAEERERSEATTKVVFTDAVIKPFPEAPTLAAVREWATDTVTRQRKLIERLNRQIEHNAELESTIEELREKIEAMGGAEFSELAGEMAELIGSLGDLTASNGDGSLSEEEERVDS